MHDPPANAVGQALYIRTDIPDYAEEAIPFQTLEELLLLGITPRPHRLLDRFVIHGLQGSTPIAVTLNFLAASHGQRPPSPEFDQP